ncbi:MAG: NAD(P)/FAD-dependent oxidoreductase [Nocardioides sp.]
MNSSGPTDVDLAVVGAGPGGSSAALVLSQARRTVAVVDDGRSRNQTARHVHGLIGRDGVEPSVLIQDAQSEAAIYGAKLLTDRVIAIRSEEGGFELTLQSAGALRARQVLLATGAVDDLPAVPGIERLWGVDVHRCPFCHGCEVIDQRITVLGVEAGSVHQALLVSQWSRDVTFLAHDLQELSDVERLQLRARGIRIVNARAQRLVSSYSGRLKMVEVDNGAPLPSDALFTMTRLNPRADLATSLGCKLDRDGFVRVNAAGRTSWPGVWAVGNLTDPHAQVVDAAAAGSRAAMMINAVLLDEDVRKAVGAISSACQ